MSAPAAEALRETLRPPGRKSPGLGQPGPRQPRRSLVVALVLACASLMVLDGSTRHGEPSPLDPVRRAVGEVFGPVEVAAATLTRPVAGVGRWFRTNDGLREDLARLEDENARLRRELHTSAYGANRVRELDGLRGQARDLGYALVPARVVGIGPAQSFGSTVTVDAGARSGLAPDMTVVNADGLVGRVLDVTATTATVLLVVDPDSVVGARVGTSMELGFLHGRGGLGDEARLDLEMLDGTEVPERGAPVVTWGSRDGAPYVAGVPVGQVVSVYSSLRETSTRAVIDPYVDFGALDLVGVVVPSGSVTDGPIIEADGSLR